MWPHLYVRITLLLLLLSFLLTSCLYYYYYYWSFYHIHLILGVFWNSNAEVVLFWKAQRKLTGCLTVDLTRSRKTLFTISRCRCSTDGDKLHRAVVWISRRWEKLAKTTAPEPFNRSQRLLTANTVGNRTRRLYTGHEAAPGRRVKTSVSLRLCVFFNKVFFL